MPPRSFKDLESTHNCTQVFFVTTAQPKSIQVSSLPSHRILLSCFLLPLLIPPTSPFPFPLFPRRTLALTATCLDPGTTSSCPRSANTDSTTSVTAPLKCPSVSSGPRLLQSKKLFPPCHALAIQYSVSFAFSLLFFHSGQIKRGAYTRIMK